MEREDLRYSTCNAIASISLTVRRSISIFNRLNILDFEEDEGEGKWYAIATLLSASATWELLERSR